MSNRNVNDLLYDSAAALRLVDRELQGFGDLHRVPAPQPESTPKAASPERYDHSTAEVMAGLGRVRQLLHESHFGVTHSAPEPLDP